LGTEEWSYSEILDTAHFVIDTLSYCGNYEFEIATTCTGNPAEFTYTTSTIVLTAGCCVAPLNAEANETTETSINVAWIPGFNISGYEIYYRITDSTEWVLSGTSMDGLHIIQNLDSCIHYEILIKPECITGFDVGTFLYHRTAGCGNCIDLGYCEAIGENSNDEFIQSVQIGDYFNQSGNNGGYVIFEETGIELGIGYDYPTTLTPGFGFFPYSEKFKLWIDLDQDGEFSEDEVLLEAESGSQDPF